jgi:hypothetical protein
MDIEEIAKKIVDAAIKMHTALGPGLFGVGVSEVHGV